MATTKLPRLKVYSKNPDYISMGSNTVVEIDGKVLPNVRFLKVEFHAKKVTKVTMELLVNEVMIDNIIVGKSEVKESK